MQNYDYREIARVIPKGWALKVAQRAAESAEEFPLKIERIPTPWAHKQIHGKHGSRSIDQLVVKTWSPAFAIYGVFDSHPMCLRIGPWQFFKRKGHTFDLKYNPYGDHRDLRFAEDIVSRYRTYTGVVSNLRGRESYRDLTQEVKAQLLAIRKSKPDDFKIQVLLEHEIDGLPEVFSLGIIRDIR